MIAPSRGMAETADVRFTPKSGHVQCTNACLLWANSGHYGCTPGELQIHRRWANYV